MSKPIHISEDLHLPLSAATQTFAFIARKGAGKTYAAGKLAEELLKQHVQVIILDTVGNWYGLRLAADGKSPGFDIPVFGGLRGDLPLQVAAGDVSADVAVETGRSMILDLSQFSLADRKRFAVTFGERLWRNKKAEAHPSPVTLFIEESQLIIPQQVTGGGDTARMVGIYEEIIRLGRNYGIGVVMITQRPQSVNKEVLNQTECLFVLQVNGAQERKALKEWIVHQGMDVSLLDELPSLPVGTSYVWSPQWLSILKKVKIGQKETFDASATPKVGDRQVRRNPAPLDMTEIASKMEATIEKAKENDPTALKKTINDLRRQLQTKEGAVKVTQKEVSVLTANDRKRITALTQKFDGIYAAVEGHYAKLENLSHVTNALKPDITALKAVLAPQPARVEPRPAVRLVVAREPRDPKPIPNGDFQPGKCEKEILRVLAQYPEGCSAGKITLLAGYRYSGGFKNSLSALRQAGCIAGENTEIMRITRRGLEYAPEDPLPTGDELANYWLTHSSLDRCARSVLQYLIDHKSAPDGEALATLTPKGDGSHYEYSGGFKNALSSLRTAGLIRGSNTGEITICDELNL